MIITSQISRGGLAFSADERRDEDGGESCGERGVALQTLIITAVLVLLAVAAGVLIVAITRSSSDDLQDQTASVESRCNQVEIYDVQIASTGRPGVSDGLEGSAVGCVPVCVIALKEIQRYIYELTLSYYDGSAKLFTLPLERVYRRNPPLTLSREEREFEATAYADLKSKYDNTSGFPDARDFITVFTGPERVKVIGGVWPVEIIKRPTLMYDNQSFFANGGTLRLSEFGRFYTTYEWEGVRLNTTKDACEFYDIRQEEVENVPVPTTTTTMMPTTTM